MCQCVALEHPSAKEQHSVAVSAQEAALSDSQLSVCCTLRPAQGLGPAVADGPIVAQLGSVAAAFAADTLRSPRIRCLRLPATEGPPTRLGV